MLLALNRSTKHTDEMGLRDTLTTVHSCLADAGVQHALIGALGLASLGIHRATTDVDLLVDGREKEIVKKALLGNLWKLAMETDEVLHFEGRGNVDFLLAHRPLSLEMIYSAKVGVLGMKCVSAEGIIGLKIQAYKNDPRREFQDKADIRALMEKYPEMNWDKVKIYADLFDEWPFIDSLRSRS